MVLVLLQKPQILLAELGEVVVFKVREYFGYHFGVLGGDRQVLLADAFPIHSAELIYLVN